MAAQRTDLMAFIELPKASLIASLALHAFGVLFFLMIPLFESMGIRIFSHVPPLKTQQEYQDFIQVDVVALPDQMIGEQVNTTLTALDRPNAQPKVPPPPVASPEVKEDEPIIELADPKKTAENEKARKQLAEKLKQSDRENALKKLAEEARRETAIKQLTKTSGVKEGRILLKGNRVSKGLSVSGLVGTPKDQYAALLKKVIQDRFSVYSWQKKRPLVAVVELAIFQNGRLKHKRLVSKSADPLYNSLVVRAIEEVELFPVPDDLRLLQGGIRLDFRSQD